MSSPPSGLDAYLDVEEQQAANFHSRILRQLLRRMLEHPGPLLGGLAMVFVGTAAAISEPRLFGYAIDEAIVPHRMDKLKTLTILFLLVVCVRVAAAISQSYLFELLGQRVTQDMRVRLFSHLQRLPVSTFDRNPAGRLLTRVTNDISSLGEMFSSGFVAVFGNVLMVAGTLGWLIALDRKLGLIVLAIFPIMIAASVYFSRRLRVAYREARSKLSALNAFIAENFLGMRVVHLFNRQKLHLERFDRINHWYADAQTGTVKVFALFQPTITWFSGAAMALVIWFGGLETYRGTLKVGVLVAFFSYVLSLFQPVREIADKWNFFISAMASAERIFAIFQWPVELEPKAVRQPALPLEELRGHVIFENVWFAYEDERWVLKDFNLEIKPGMRVGVVGHTGAGKTTLISLLMRFYEPQRGRILLDGKDLRDYDKRRLRASIGIVQQDVFLFSGSLKDNMTFWNPSSSDKLKEMLESVGFTKGWEGDRQVQLEERGSNLSVGERQVLAFGRALSADPRIWILDEATANMDSQTERMLSDVLGRASRGRTSILIAHRLATVQNADKILVLHKGSLVEQGKHAELMKVNGLYARLYRYQKAQDENQAQAISQTTESV